MPNLQHLDGGGPRGRAGADHRSTGENRMKSPYESKALRWSLLLIFLLIWFYALEARTLVPTDEGRYAEMAREMVASKDWITSRLNGIKYFEKPPLQTWMNALTFTLFGLGEWQARLWTGLCGLFGIALVSHAGRKVFGPRAGFSAAVVLASSFFWAAMSHVNTLDMGLSAMMTLSLCGLLLAQRNDARPDERRNWMLACWAGMALAVLSKGLIGIVLPGAVLVLYTLFARDWAIWKRLLLVFGLLFFFVFSTPRIVLVSLKNPEFPHFFFIHEHLQRFTSKIHHRAGPWHYFIPILLVGILPWLGMLAQSLWSARHEEAKRFQPKKMLLIWAVFIFFLFSISNSKLPSYILPIFPALALLIAWRLENGSSKDLLFSSALLAVFCVVVLVFVLCFLGLAGNPYEAPLYQSYTWWVAAAAVLGLLGSAASLLLARRQREWAILVLAATGFVGGQLAMLGHEPLGRYAAGALHVQALEAELTPQTPLYAVGRYVLVLFFYLQRTLTLVEHADELEFGLEQEPQLWIPKRADFIKKWSAASAAGKKSDAILNPDVFAVFLLFGVSLRFFALVSRCV